MELVSIIIPVYNVEKYLSNCIESVCNQTYNNIEILLIDDGSTDGSGLIADNWSQRDKRVKVYHEKNAGSGKARNKGIDVASGKYVTFVDSDDLVDSDLVELLMEGLKNGSDACVGGFKRIDENGQIISREVYLSHSYIGEEVYYNLFSRMLGSSPNSHDAIKMAVWNAIYSMDIVRKHNLKFPSQEEYYSEDLYFNYEYFKYSRKANVIDSTAYAYRVTPGSLTQKYKANLLESVSSLYVKMELKLNDAKMITRLQRQFFVNIRTCLRQEHFSVSGKKPNEIREAIIDIVNHPVVCRVATSYLKCIKQFKQKIFVFMVRYKIVNLLYFVIKFRLL